MDAGTDPAAPVQSADFTYGVPSPALPYAPAGAAGWPAETKAIVACAAVVSVAQLATTGNVLWMRLAPTLYRRGGVDPWPLLSFTTATVMLRGVCDVLVIAGAVAAAARMRSARRLLLIGAAGLVVLVTYGFVRSAAWGPGQWVGYKGADFFGQVVYDGTYYVQTVIVRALLVYAMTRPHVKAASRSGS